MDYKDTSKETLNNLKNSKIYRTDLDGSVEIELKRSGHRIRTCSS